VHRSPLAIPAALDAWRVFRILSEFVEGFETMTDLGPSVAIFGSSRIKENDPYYNISVQLAEKIVQKGFGIITGGGPGIMEAANEGARTSSGKSCGLCIDVPNEAPNPFIDNEYLLKFRYFFVRKVMFVRYAQAFVVLPGGYGTMDELFEALTLIQTKKAKPFPVYLLGSEYWQGLIKWLKDRVLESGNISPCDLDLFTVTDDLDQIANGIADYYNATQNIENF
jgi:uncharacterized protein (TIGR00730 family)